MIKKISPGRSSFWQLTAFFPTSRLLSAVWFQYGNRNDLSSNKMRIIKWRSPTFALDPLSPPLSVHFTLYCTVIWGLSGHMGRFGTTFSTMFWYFWLVSVRTYTDQHQKDFHSETCMCLKTVVPNQTVVHLKWR